MGVEGIYEDLERITARPEPFAQADAAALWTDPHVSERMLAYHLDGVTDVSSRNAPFIRRSIEWMVSRFGIGKGTHIADFGCGPGLYANGLARLGAQVTGIDFSARSIAYARGVATSEGLGVHYVHQNYLEFRTAERFDLITMIMCDYCALSPAQRQVLLGIYHEVLAPGGAVLLDVSTPVAFDRLEEARRFAVNLGDGFWAPGRYYGFQITFKYPAERAILDKYTIIERERTRTVHNWLQYLTPEEVWAEFAAAGLAVEETLGDVAGAPYDAGGDEFAVVGRKA